MKAPIVLFAYNRADYIKRVIDSLQKCYGVNEHECFVFVDSPNKYKMNDYSRCNEVKKILEEIKIKNNFKSFNVIYFDSHKGLKKAVISGLDKVFEKYNRVIDVEDDIVVSQDFLDYMDGALDFYKEKEDVWSISAYTPDLPGIDEIDEDFFKLKRVSSWGFATWKDRWNKVDWDMHEYDEFEENDDLKDVICDAGYDFIDLIRLAAEGLIDSWATIWQFYSSINDAFTVYPKRAKAINIGLEGEHNSGTAFIQRKIEIDNAPYRFDLCKYDRNFNELYRCLFMKKDSYNLKKNNKNELVSSQYYNLLYRWIKMKQSGFILSDKLIEKGIKRLIVYGAGDLASILIGELKSEQKGVEVVGVLDLKKKGCFFDLIIKEPSQIGNDFDAVIVTPVLYYREIYRNLRHYSQGNIISIAELIR